MINRIKAIISSNDERTRLANINSLLSLVFKGLSILISFIVIPMTLNFLNPFDYGIWITLSSMLTWIYSLDAGLGNGLRNKLAIAIANKDFELGRILVSTTFFLMILLVLLILIVFSLVFLLVDWNAFLNVPIDMMPNLGNVIFVVFLFFCLSFVFRIIGIVYIADQRIALNDFLAFLGSLLSCIIIYVLTKTMEGNLFIVALAFSASPVVIYILAYPFTFGGKYKVFAPSIRAIKLRYTRELVGLGMQFFFLQIACVLIFATSNIIISKIFGPAEVTPYNIAFKYYSAVTLLFGILLSPFWTAITDAYAKGDILWIERGINRMTKIWISCTLGLILLGIVSEFVFKLWIGDVIQVSFSLSIAMIVYSSLLMWSQLYASFSNGIGKLKLQLFSMSVASILFIPIAILFSMYWGVEGIMYAMAFVLTIPGVTLFIQYRKLIVVFKKENHEKE